MAARHRTAWFLRMAAQLSRYNDRHNMTTFMHDSLPPKTLLSFLLFFIKKQWRKAILIQLFCCAWAIDHTLWPYVIMSLVDTLTNYAGDRTEVWSALVGPISMGLALWFVVEPSYRFAGVLSAYFFPRLEADIRMTMYGYVLQHSPQYFTQNMPGAVANKISDMPRSTTRLLQRVMIVFVPVSIALVISFSFFAAISSMLASILLLWIVVHTSLCLLYSRSCDHTSAVHAEAQSTLAGKIVDGLTNSGNIRLFARAAFEKEYLQEYQDDENRKQTAALLTVERMKWVMGLVSFLGTFIGLNSYMIYQWQQGHLTTGQVVFVFNTAWNIAMMAWYAGAEMPTFFKEMGVCKQALSVIQHPHEIRDVPNAPELRVAKGDILFDHVTFAYKKGQNLFADKTIKLNAGQKVGLVGFSGSGKTTFVNLILRHYDVQGGRILIDGQDISQVTQESLRRQITVIPQDPILFHRSLIENIRYSRLDATDEEVVQAAQRAKCDEFIQKMPEKYKSFVGDRGTKLSGGQRQRIAIARAMLKNLPRQIFILDEATSALDAVTEQEVQTVLEELIEGHTTLVIAHRLATLCGMDRILVFKEGKIIEDGNHEELLAAQGHYATMWEMQVGGFLPEQDLDEDYDEYDEEEEEGR